MAHQADSITQATPKKQTGTTASPFKPPQSTSSPRTPTTPLPHLQPHLLPPSLLPLLSKNLPTHRQNPLKTLPPLSRILPKPLNRKILNPILNLLPPTTKRNNLSRLLETRAPSIRQTRPIRHSLLNTEQIIPSHVLTAHCDFLGAGVDVADFVDEAGFVAAEDGAEPFGSGLAAGYKTFGSEDMRRGVQAAREGVDADYVRGLVIPGAVFEPVACADFFPAVGEFVGGRVELHRWVGW